MADKAVANALQLLAAQVTFREETDEIKFAEAVAAITAEEPAEEEAEDLDALTKAELVARAEAAGIDFDPSDTKAELVAKLEEG